MGTAPAFTAGVVFIVTLQEKMDNRGLLFIPDISGFTQFIHKTDIEHSRLIIQELLEVLINANETGLEVSEIEGDAILFYKFGEAPPLATIYRQVQKMFCEFHKRLIIYDHHRYCQCQACMSAIGLTLKVVTHYGEFTGYTIRNFNKLIGKDVIVAHQLLKNDIEQHEYWLVTSHLSPEHAPHNLTQWMEWNSSSRSTEDGEITFHYTQLGQLKNEIEPEPPVKLELAKKTKVFSVSREYDTDFIRLFHAAGDFRYRHLWQTGVKSVEMFDHFLPRVGMRHKSIQEGGEVIIYSSSYTYSPDQIEFSETEEKKKSSVYFILKDKGDGKVKLTLDYYIEKGLAGPLMFNMLRKKKLEEVYRQSLINLEKVVNSIRLPSESP